MADSLDMNEHALNAHAPDSYSSQLRYSAGDSGGTATSEVYSWPRRLHNGHEPRDVPRSPLKSLPAGAPNSLPPTRVVHAAPVPPVRKRAHSYAHWMGFGATASAAPERAAAGDNPASKHMASREITPVEEDFQFNIPHAPGGTGAS